MKVKLWKIKETYKIFKEGTIIEEIEEKRSFINEDGKENFEKTSFFVVQNEWSKGVEKDYFNDMKLGKSFKTLLEPFGTKDLFDCKYFEVKLRYWSNEIDILERKIQIIKNAKQEFLSKFGMKEKDLKDF